jgi:ATP-dependent RNA helicase DeaD
MEKRLFTELGLSPEVLKAVEKMGFEEASPIQTAVIPTILSGRDVVGQSSTGSGKTAAFAIPAIDKVDVQSRAVQVLILLPTRELAVQVAEEVAKLAYFKRGLRELPVYGGQSYERQFRGLDAGAQVVIGTPGRLMDHMERGSLKLDKLKLVILDEADRMLDMGFREDIEKILSSVPEQRQLLFFSATMPKAIQDLIKRYSRDPAWIKIESSAQNAPQVEQVYFEVDRRSKVEALTRLIDVHDFRYGIIFCSTKIMCDELAEILAARGYAVDRLHGDITQMQRNRVMDKFRKRGFEFLVATDVAARGLDVDDLEVVFNYDLPNDAEDYTHRIGRTGRAGKAGRAFTFVCGRELWVMQNFIRYAKLKIRRETIPSLDQVEEARENVFFEKLRDTLNAAKFRKQERMIDRLLEQGYPSTDICSALIHLLQGGAPEKPEGKPAAKAPTSAAPSWATKKAAPPTAAALSSSPAVVAPVKGAAAPAPQAAVVARSWAGPATAHAVKPKVAAPVEKPRPPGEVIRVPIDGAIEVTRGDGDFAPPARTGVEKGFTTIFLNVGRKHLVTPADIVGKVAGVTRLPGNVVGAIDIHQRHTLVDVAEDQALFVIEKLTGIRVKGESLVPSVATAKDKG